jgi:hypothetical protein
MAAVIKGRDSFWTEWQFVPDALGAAKGPVQKSYALAREDARVYATTLEPSHV